MKLPGWLLFYVTPFVEFSALLQAVWGLIRKRELKWQKWQRSAHVEVAICSSIIHILQRLGQDKS